MANKFEEGVRRLAFFAAWWRHAFTPSGPALVSPSNRKCFNVMSGGCYCGGWAVSWFVSSRFGVLSAP